MNEHEPKYGSVVGLGDNPAQELIGIFGDQLKRFARMRRTHEEELNSRGRRVLNKVIVARICDLRDLGHFDPRIINPS